MLRSRSRIRMPVVRIRDGEIELADPTSPPRQARTQRGIARNACVRFREWSKPAGPTSSHGRRRGFRRHVPHRARGRSPGAAGEEPARHGAVLHGQNPNRRRGLPRRQRRVLPRDGHSAGAWPAVRRARRRPTPRTSPSSASRSRARAGRTRTRSASAFSSAASTATCVCSPSSASSATSGRPASTRRRDRPSTRSTASVHSCRSISRWSFRRPSRRRRSSLTRGGSFGS